MWRVFFIYLLMDTYVASIPWLLLITLWTLGCIYVFELASLCSLNTCPEVRLLNPVVVLSLGFWGASILVSTVVHPFTFPPVVCEGPPLSTLSLASIICGLFMVAILKAVMPHCSFDLQLWAPSWKSSAVSPLLPICSSTRHHWLCNNHPMSLPASTLALTGWFPEWSLETVMPGTFLPYSEPSNDSHHT